MVDFPSEDFYLNFCRFCFFAENPEKAWRIKQYRQEKAIASLIERNAETDKSYAEQLKDKEASMSKKMSKAKGVF